MKPALFSTRGSTRLSTCSPWHTATEQSYAAACILELDIQDRLSRSKHAIAAGLSTRAAASDSLRFMREERAAPWSAFKLS